MKRRNALLPTDVELQMQSQQGIDKALDKIVAAYIKYQIQVKAAEEEVFKALFKQAEYQRGDVVFISCDLQSEIGFDCDQIKFSSALPTNQYLAMRTSAAPQEIGQ